MSNGYVTRNFAAHGGNEWVIGGKLTFVEGAEIEGLSEALASAPLFTPVANQADSTASTIATLKEDFNALLAALKTAGLMEADTPEEENGDDDEDGDDENGEGNGGSPEEPGGDA